MPITGDPVHDPSTVAYDQQLIPWLFEHWAEPFIDLAAPIESSRLLDLACGSGLITRKLLRRLDQRGQINAVDFDPAMLEYASSTIDDERVSWHAADAANLPFDDHSVDGILCHQGLQFFPDRPAALAEIQRTLRPARQLTIAVWGRIEDNPWPAALAAATRTILGDDAAAGMTTVCALGDPAQVASLLHRAGFERVTAGTRERTVTHPDTRDAVAGQLAALPSGSITEDLDDERRGQVAAEMCAQLAPHTDLNGTLTIPSTSVVASAISP